MTPRPPRPRFGQALIGALASNRDRLFEKELTFTEEFSKQSLLVGDTVCDSRLVSSARKGGGLLGEFSNIAADNRDAFIELHQGRAGHWSSLSEQTVEHGALHKLACFSALLPPPLS